MVIANAMLTWSLAALYFGMVGVWALMTAAVWWRRRRAAPDLVGDLPDLDAYELVRLDRGRFGQIEVMMAQLLESGVLERGSKWGDPESKWFPQNKTYQLRVRSGPGHDAHELERAFVTALGQRPDKDALTNASDVTDGEPCDQIEARLIADGLLYDDSRRWHLAWFGWALFWIGLSWSIARFIAYDLPPDSLTDWLFIVGCGLLLPVFMSQPDTAGQPDATPNGRLVVERERNNNMALCESFSAPDVRLAVALYGADTVGHEHAGVRDAYELLKAESERYVGL